MRCSLRDFVRIRQSIHPQVSITAMSAFVRIVNLFCNTQIEDALI